MVNPTPETHDYFIKCNGAEILIDMNDGGRPKLGGEWGGEQCEGCGADMVHDALCVVSLPAMLVRCSNCEAKYTILTSLHMGADSGYCEQDGRY